MDKSLIKGSTITLILSTLKNEPLYGYAIIKGIECRSNGLFIFKEGTLYPILHTLERDNLIESFWEEENGRRRKYYHVTSKGLKELDKRSCEWQLFSKTMNHVLGGI